MSAYRCSECGHVGEYVAPGVVCTPALTAAADANMTRAAVYRVAIRSLNAERDRAKGRGTRAKKKRKEIAAVIEYLANDPAFITLPDGRAPP